MIKVNNNNLPENWVLTTIGEIGIVVSGGTPSTRQPDFWGGEIAWITPADLSNHKDKYIQKGQRNITRIGLDNSSAKLLPKGSIMFSSRAPIGYTVIAKNEISTNQGFKNIILTNSGYSDYIYYYLFSSKQLAKSFASGTTFLELSATKFNQIPFPLPPLAEQHRIVEKIEELFSELDKAQESLLNAQKQLEIYRQVVLQDAFEGKYTKGYLSNIENVEVGKQKQFANNYFLIPDTWNYKKFGEITINYDNLRKPISAIKRKEVQGKYPYYGATEIIDYIDNYIFEGEYLLIGEDGANLLSKSKPLAFIVNGKFWVNNHAHIVKTIDEVNLTYLKYYFNSIKIDKFVSGSAQPKLTKTNLNKIQIPICNLREQKQIVTEIEYRFTLIENLANSITENLKRIKIFRQTILQKAFSGKLVSQFETDEPASELLKRIKEEIKEYLIQQKEIAKNKPQKLVFMESNKTVKQILEEATEPLEAKEIWQKSIHKDDIEKFYEELKQISESIEEIREGITSKLILKR
ncbi:MAG: hypothetical protein A2275_05740 [Bacteroidetes bacterium RIFOXYA12_FULL_35_11]|nr:MAG: hypothetical protein A2X01_10900 [Bacteroidetes bacterium GWF2_35_48]OFY74983.1 MAG: hypothetical protein A2275_05740 [Bacteroidetes bacterium RIFOXYA12_FULL_35_11]OFY97375.1 MAG: hypothetical protein A2309_14150 [Bacteroidetes bacterium RIFOXYB2_FULL_35_7]HBX52822.1 hypothetical protein [Bacteroidales bacterium]